MLIQLTLLVCLTSSVAVKVEIPSSQSANYQFNQLEAMDPELLWKTFLDLHKHEQILKNFIDDASYRSQDGFGKSLEKGMNALLSFNHHYLHKWSNDSRDTRERVSKSHQRLVQRLGVKVHPVRELRYVQQHDILEEVYKEKLLQEFGDIPTNERFWHMTVSNHFRRCAKALIEDATAREYSSIDAWHKPMFDALRFNINRSWRGPNEPDSSSSEKDFEQLYSTAEQVLQTLKESETVDRLKKKLHAAKNGDELEREEHIDVEGYDQDSDATHEEL
ncbi:hypothetical protein AAVH_08565 [Aphelenchoides avenae]|nr:hypothetical protein AAVH_08565 [Aphelenchus avenae]